MYISTKVSHSILVLEYASTVSAAYPNPKKNHTWTNLLSTQKDMQTKKMSTWFWDMIMEMYN